VLYDAYNAPELFYSRRSDVPSRPWRTAMLGRFKHGAVERDEVCRSRALEIIRGSQVPCKINELSFCAGLGASGAGRVH